MPNQEGLFSRPDKGDDAETVLYEIDMLRVCVGRLGRPFESEKDEWVYLEGFLLHYRNLIEFFSGRPRLDTDLSIARPADIWPLGTPDKKEIEAMTRLDLWQKYDSFENHESISKYLNHCTKHRVLKKDWDVKRMYEELRPTIDKFDSLLPSYRYAESAATRNPVLRFDSFSTTSMRVLDSALDFPFEPEFSTSARADTPINKRITLKDMRRKSRKLPRKRRK